MAITNVQSGPFIGIAARTGSGGVTIASPSLSGSGTNGASGTSSVFFNSMEATGPNDVLTDDFWRGSWYLNSGDNTPNYRTTAPGWGGTAFSDLPPVNGAAVNLQAIGKKPLFTRSNYVATSGAITPGNNSRYHAWHNLSGAGSGGYAEIFIRYYTYFVEANFYGAGNPSASYTWGGQKSITVNRWNDDSGIYWAGVGYNIGGGGGQTTGSFNATNNHATGDIIYQNQGVDIAMSPGRWYFAEIRIKLNTVGSSNGVFQLWITDGGSTGNFSGLSPVLRSSYSNINWGRTAGETSLIGVLWLENWSNAQNSPSLGEQFWANVKVATAGPIGFAA